MAKNRGAQETKTEVSAEIDELPGGPLWLIAEQILPTSPYRISLTPAGASRVSATEAVIDRMLVAAKQEIDRNSKPGKPAVTSLRKFVSFGEEL